MKKLCISLLTLSTFLFTGCASYQASSLSALDPGYVKEYPQVEGLSIGSKAYSINDCYNFLDRNVIAKGYQPIQLTFQNLSDKRYVFSTDRVSLPCVDSEKVAQGVHTSTVGRVTGYSIGGLLLWPLFIPAVVDGIKSSGANKSLDVDFDTKSKNHLVINPGSYSKTLIFVPKNDFQPIFDISLLEEETGTYKTIGLSVAQ